MEEMTNDNKVIDRGGCTLLGDSICPTLIAGYYKMVGNTQDAMTIIILEADDEPGIREPSAGLTDKD